jgi:hypothetical protein
LDVQFGRDERISLSARARVAQTENGRHGQEADKRCRGKVIILKENDALGQQFNCRPNRDAAVKPLS